jgi:Regulator of chromosome condensation (RCC1) repeat
VRERARCGSESLGHAEAGWAPRLLIAAVLATALAGVGSRQAGTAGLIVANGAADAAAPRATSVTAGLGHTCGLTGRGTVKCWGYNGHDELGTGDTNLQGSSVPVDVSGLRSGVTAISAGLRHSCAVTKRGGVKCWGAAYSGALGDGTADRRPTPVDVVGLSSAVTAVSAGYDHSCALTAGGGVKCWGYNERGELGDGTTTDRWTPVGVSGLSSGVTAISTGALISCALMTSGGVKCWGVHYCPTPADVPGLGGVTAITAGGPLCALTTPGGAKCWLGEYGPTPVDVPGLSSGVTAISASAGHTCALTAGGGVKCWGENDRGQLGDGTKTKRPTPVAVSGLRSGVTGISAGGFHTCAVTRAGAIKCWGLNGGALGDGTMRLRVRPVRVVGFGPEARLAILARSVMVTPAGFAPIKLRCRGAACKGTLILVHLGSRRFSIAAGSTKTALVKLTARGFRRLLRLGTLSTRARARYDDALTARTITLKAPK